MELVKRYEIKIRKYNFSDVCFEETRKMNKVPEESDLMDFYKEIEVCFPRYKDYYTTIHIEEYYVTSR